MKQLSAMWSCPQHLAVFLPPHMQHHPTSFIGPSPLPARSKLTHLKLSLCLAADILCKCLSTSQWYKLMIQPCLENQNWGTLANVFRLAYNLAPTCYLGKDYLGSTRLGASFPL